MKYSESESSTLEFKEKIPQNEQIIKTVIGFCNQNGGKLVIGVTDNGVIVGIPSEEAASAIAIDRCDCVSSFNTLEMGTNNHRFGEKMLRLFPK